MKILHAIHDFLPRHRAGSEIYAGHLCRALAGRHDVHVLCAEYDPERTHGTVTLRSHEGLAVSELVNNWTFSSFEETYRQPRINESLDGILARIKPDVLHVHNLLTLSFDLPKLARARGIPTVATLHDYTLVCPSGGQRVHIDERHVCQTIDPERCSRCFPQSPLYRQMAASGVASRTGRVAGVAAVGNWVRRQMPGAFRALEDTIVRFGEVRVTPEDILKRLEYAKGVFESIDLFVAPSSAIGDEYLRLGLPPGKLAISDYGFPGQPRSPRRRPGQPLRIGFVGTLVWHKGVHVLLEAVRRLPPGMVEVKIFGDTATFPDYTQSLLRLGAGHPVQFLGAFDPARSHEPYQLIDVLVVPSLWPENSPLVIHEAFMAGVPVIGSSQGGIPGLVTHGRNGLLYDAFSVDDLVSTLNTVLRDPACLERFTEHLPAVKDIEQDAREWEARYASVVGGQPVVEVSG